MIQTFRKSVFIFLITGLLSVPSSWANPNLASEFRGAELINQILMERIGDARKQTGFSIREFFIKFGGLNQPDLADLFGVYRTVGMNIYFFNGKPNSINLIIWNLLAHEISLQISKLCAPQPRQDLLAMLNPVFSKNMESMCSWSKQKNAEREKDPDGVLQTYWIALMDFDAPWEEFLSWKEFILNEESANVQGEQLVYEATYSILMNPHFLLAK